MIRLSKKTITYLYSPRYTSLQYPIRYSSHFSIQQQQKKVNLKKISQTYLFSLQDTIQTEIKGKVIQDHHIF